MSQRFQKGNAIQNVWKKTQKILDFVENSNFIWESIKAAVRGYSGETS